MLEELNESNFLEKIMGDSLSVIDFYAEWCMPCHAIAKTLEKLSTEYDGGRVKFYKISTTKNASLTSQLKISETPIIIFFRDAEHIDIQRGVAKEERLREKINALLGG